MTNVPQWEKEFDERFSVLGTPDGSEYFKGGIAPWPRNIKSFIRALVSETETRTLNEVALAFGRYWPISGTDMEDLPKLAKEMTEGLRAGVLEEVQAVLPKGLFVHSLDGHNKTKPQTKCLACEVEKAHEAIEKLKTV